MGFDELQDAISNFSTDRDWDQFHTVRNLILATQGELGELAEIVQWIPDEEINDEWLSRNHERLSEEWADVFIYLLRLAQIAGIDPAHAALKKIESNALKYPVGKAKGTSKKYTDL